MAGVALWGGISYEQGAAAVGGRTSWHIMSMLYMSMFLVHALAAFLMAAGWICKSRLLSFHTALQVFSAFATVGTVVIESTYFVRRATIARTRADCNVPHGLDLARLAFFYYARAACTRHRRCSCRRCSSSPTCVSTT